MEDLDAELLAVTEGKNRSRRADSDNSPSSGAEFEGIADSDGNDDDDDDPMLDAGSDEEDDDDEFGLDEDDDDDYGAKKRKRAPPKRKKKTTKRKQVKKEQQSEEEDDDVFEYPYDADGYGDAKDRERLMRMNEVDRETLLDDRVEARTKEYELWKMKREMMSREKKEKSTVKKARSSGRTKANSKNDALQALAEDKRKKSSRALDEVSDADSEVERIPKREKKEDKLEAKEEPDVMDSDEGPELRYADFVKEGKSTSNRQTSALFLRRDMLVQLSQQPYFERVVVGLFARVRSLGGSYDDNSYLLCRISEVRTGKVYSPAQGVRTNFHLLLHIGKGKKEFPIHTTSNSSPSEREFDVYRIRMLDAGYSMPRREEVDKLLKRAREQVFQGKIQPTEAENKKHIANMELCYPQRVNWTQKRTEVRTALEIKRMELNDAKRKEDREATDKLQAEVDELVQRMREIEKNEEKYGVKSGKTDAQVFHSLARRNMALNTNNERLLAKRMALEAGAGGIDPFARFDTTGQSYFSIKRKGESDEGEVKAKENAAQKAAQADWRASLKTWRRGGKRMKISDIAVDKLYAGEVIGLEDFKMEVENSKMKKVKMPPIVDAMYITGIQRNHFVLPKKAKVISFEEWSKMRGN